MKQPIRFSTSMFTGFAVLAIFFCKPENAGAQSLAVNTSGATASVSSILDVSSTNKGILIPRVSLTGTGDVTTIASPATSLLVYNTSSAGGLTPGYYYWNGTAWVSVAYTTTWLLRGNSGTSAATHFIGSTDNVPLVFKVNNQKAGLIDVAPNLFLGYQAGLANTGNENTGLGYQALYSNNTGGGNTATGTYALGLSTSGSGNTATGAWALAYNQASFNSAFGDLAMSHVSTGENNSAFGAYAMDGSPFMTGSDNVAMGYLALTKNFDGNKNVALGRDAMYFNTSGNENTGIGYQSLYLNGTGNYNTATGSQAMKNVGTGSYNVANGYQALFNGSGSNNTAIGYSAMAGSGSGSFNTAVGGEALPLNSTGFNNTALGYHTLGENSTGNYNTAVGRDALRSNHIGSYNVGIGYNALINDNNDGNTAVGTNSGMNASNGTNCTFIGYQAGVSSGSLTNATAIGANAVVAASNSLVLGDYTNISVGIGITAPLDVLHVKGIGEHQVTIEAYALPVGLLFKEAGADAARIQHHGSGSYLQIQDYTAGWFETGLVINQGSVGIGTTGPTAKLSVNGTANNTTGSWAIFSDERIKKVKDGFTDGLSVIRKIRPVLFTYNDKAPFKNTDVQVGIVAQELEKIAPYMVTKKKYGDFTDLREVNNQAYVFLLINAVNEQQNKIEELEKKLKELSLKLK